jgi:glycerol-3-phosphate O-acyltransferase/dihydroxyacetone phosphate acyltransferase
MAQQPYIPPLIGWLYDLVLWAFSVLVDFFFREVHPRGSWKIPRKGPMIIVAAPHANQVGLHHATGSCPEKLTNTGSI